MSPSLSQRIAEQQRGVAAPVMHQRWTDLLFLHWKWDAADLQSRLPAGLTLDLHEGTAWLGVVPFFMQRIRPRFLPPVPWLSWFLELNVRTYVHDAQGRPGVWFFSLDCNQPVAVQLARSLFRLPYFHAAMCHEGDVDSSLHYRCRRRNQPAEAAAGIRWKFTGPPPGAPPSQAATPGAPPSRRLSQAASPGAPPSRRPHQAAPGTLDFFLLERYVLFAATRTGIRSGTVAHVPYPVVNAELLSPPESAAQPLVWNGFQAPARPPDHICGSPGVDVRVGALESRLPDNQDSIS